MGKKLTTKEFIKKAKNIHGDRYGYEEVEYKGNKEKVKIMCKEHGVFEQIPFKHLYNQGCRKCSKNAKYTTISFIEKAKLSHGYKYNYSKINYTNCKTKVTIICKEHGEFLQTPNSHLKGKGCKKCANKKLRTDRSMGKDEFIKKSIIAHKGIYSYEYVDYINCETKVKIKCELHGCFYQRPYCHLNGEGCKHCGIEKGSKKRFLTLEEFINRSIIIHGNKYVYEKTKYYGNNEKVKIICKIHGEFEQIPSNHLQGNGCPKCQKRILGTSEFIKESIMIHGDRYDYSIVDFTFSKKKIKIICKYHGLFEQIAIKHLCGQGCPKCNMNHGERSVENFLSKNNFSHDCQKYLEGCIHVNKLYFDFYLPDHNICIEYDGEQHFKSVEFFGGEEVFKLTKIRDEIKNEYCRIHGIRLIRIRYDEDIESRLYWELRNILRNNLVL